jgi:hypothetical protein
MQLVWDRPVVLVVCLAACEQVFAMCKTHGACDGTLSAAVS